MTREAYTCRSTSTGKYHRTYDPNITFCNYSGQRRSGHNIRARDEDVARADPSMFCRKCFPQGKPE